MLNWQIWFAYLQVCCSLETSATLRNLVINKNKSSGKLTRGDNSWEGVALCRIAVLRFFRATVDLLMQGCPLKLTETKYLLEFVGPLRHRVKFRLHEAHRSSWLSISLTLKHLRTSSVISSEMRKQWEVVLLLQTEHFTTQVSQKSNYCMGFKIDFICNIRHANKFPAKKARLAFYVCTKLFSFSCCCTKKQTAVFKLFVRNACGPSWRNGKPHHHPQQWGVWRGSFGYRTGTLWKWVVK